MSEQKNPLFVLQNRMFQEIITQSDVNSQAKARETLCFSSEEANALKASYWFGITSKLLSGQNDTYCQVITPANKPCSLFSCTFVVLRWD